MRLKDKVCIVTGSSRGFGAQIAERLHKDGGIVIVTYLEGDIKEEKNAQIVGEKVASPLIVPVDVSNRASVKKMIKEIAEKFGRIDVLVNNAGINRTADFDKQTDEEWDEVIDVNISGVFRCCQEVLPHISDYGRIINIGSISGEYGGPRTPSYAAAKQGVIALTHNVARFLGKRNICVNTLSPGVIAGEFTENSMAPDVKETVLRLMLIKRFAKYDEMVGAAIFLASDESSYLTAQTISINGGAWSH